MAYNRVNWRAKPSTATPITPENLNIMDKGIADLESQLQQIADDKVSKDEVSNVLTPKGKLLYSLLPTIDNQIGDYYYCPDGNGTDPAGNYIWNGADWYFGGTGDQGYNKITNDLNKYVVERTINLVQPTDFTDNYYISSASGNIAGNVNYCCITQYIEIEANTWYALYSVTGTINPQVAWYDENKVYIGGATSRTFKTGATAKFLRISFEKTYKASVILSKGQFSQKREYVPYYQMKKSVNNFLTLKDFETFTLGGYGETITNAYSTGYTTSFTNRSTLLFNRPSAGLKTGDFIFGRCKIKANTNVDQANVQVVGSDGVYYNNVFRGLKANKEYTLFFRSSNFTAETATTMYLRINLLKDDGSATTTAEVSEICLSVNHYDCWYDEATKASLPNFYTNTYTVGLEGRNHFFDIAMACEFAKRANNALVTPVVIAIKNGFYDIYIGDNEPYAINKGSNRISLIGESKQGTILRKLCTATKQGRIIEAGGPCSIENMTLIQERDSTFVSEYTNSRAYCIHLDLDFISLDVYETLVKNVRCINYINAPIGAGLRNNQRLIYDDVEHIYMATTGLNGAFYTHGPSNPSDGNCELVVNDCLIQDLVSTGRTILMDDVPGCLSFKNIPCTFTRNIAYSEKGTIVEADFKTNHKIMPVSSLNNILDFNY